MLIRAHKFVAEDIRLVVAHDFSVLVKQHIEHLRFLISLRRRKENYVWVQKV